MIGLAIGGGLLLIVLIWVAVTLNRFARLQNLIRESWADVDVALQRRYDLIPNLVESVKGYAAFEQTTLQKVIDARNNAVSQVRSLPLQAVSEMALSQAIMGLMARVEAYPELKASQHFAMLQQELADTEDRIAAARRFYNANVRDYGIALKSFPGSLLAGGRVAPDFFQAEPGASAPVHVDLSSSPR